MDKNRTNLRPLLEYGAAGVFGISAAQLLGYARLNPLLLVAVTWVLWMATIAAWVRIIALGKLQR